MGFTELIFTSLGLSMDAFSAAVCRGTSMKKRVLPAVIITALFFGLFQAVMPIIGCFLSNSFISGLDRYDNDIAFGLLTLLGAKMIIEAIFDKEEGGESSFGIIQLLLLALATSIDAMAVGFVFASQDIKPLFPSAVIGIITFVVSGIGVCIGKSFGAKWGREAEIFGGIVLILIGAKFLLEGIK